MNGGFLTLQKIWENDDYYVNNNVAINQISEIDFFFFVRGHLIYWKKKKNKQNDLQNDLFPINCCYLYLIYSLSPFPFKFDLYDQYTTYTFDVVRKGALGILFFLTTVQLNSSTYIISALLYYIRVIVSLEKGKSLFFSFFPPHLI